MFLAYRPVCLWRLQDYVLDFTHLLAMSVAEETEPYNLETFGHITRVKLQTLRAKTLQTFSSPPYLNTPDSAHQQISKIGRAHV